MVAVVWLCSEVGLDRLLKEPSCQSSPNPGKQDRHGDHLQGV